MRGRGGHRRWQNPADMRSGLQQAGLPRPTIGHTRAHRMGDRPVPDLQGCPRTLLGGGGQRQRLPPPLGHIRGPREGQKIRLWKIGCGALVF